MSNRLFVKFISSLVMGLGVTFGLINLVTILGVHPLVTHAANYTVCPAGPPVCAYATIQAAVDAAGDGDVIKVVAGTYTDINNYGGLTQTVYLSKSVTIQGGYATPSSLLPDPKANPTILDAQGQGRVFYITGDISPTIEGFYITGGDAVGLEGDPAYDAGGGVYVITASATIRHNYIYSNTVSPRPSIAGVGSGVYLINSNALIEHNTIISNTTYSGSAIYIESSPATIRYNLIARNNSSHSGGGLSLVNSDVTVTQNEIMSNTAGYWGGGVILGGNGTPVLKNNTIANNQVGAVGGGIILNTGAVILESNVIVSNQAGSDLFFGGSGGGALLISGEVTLINNLIAKNSVWTSDEFDRGSGLYLSASTGQLLHNTFAQNEGGNGSGIYFDDNSMVTLTNTILANHSIAIQGEAGSTAALESTLWFGNSMDWSGAGVINTNNDYFDDPAFINPTENNYHLSSMSAAIDAGVEAGVATDFEGDSRPLGEGFDIGADEFNAGIPITEGTITLTPGVTLTVGSGTFSETIRVVYTPRPPTATGNLNHVGLFYDISAVYASNGQPAQPQPGQRYTITVTYQQADVPFNVSEADLALYYWDGLSWVKEPTSVVDVEANTITATPDHFSLWAALAESTAVEFDEDIFLPLILK